MTDWGYYEAARRFQRVLVAAGIDSALQARGVLVRGVAPGRLAHRPAVLLLPMLTWEQPRHLRPHHARSLPQDGDTVVIGDLEFEYDSDKSESGMYDKWCALLPAPPPCRTPACCHCHHCLAGRLARTCPALPGAPRLACIRLPCCTLVCLHLQRAHAHHGNGCRRPCCAGTASAAPPASWAGARQDGPTSPAELNACLPLLLFLLLFRLLRSTCQSLSPQPLSKLWLHSLWGGTGGAFMWRMSWQPVQPASGYLRCRR